MGIWSDVSSLLVAFFCSAPLAEPFFRPGPHDDAAVARSGGWFALENQHG
jgi:hypothetical protein